jgi:3-methyladenine DNA glycosylase AlkD
VPARVYLASGAGGGQDAVSFADCPRPSMGVASRRAHRPNDDRVKPSETTGAAPVSAPTRSRPRHCERRTAARLLAILICRPKAFERDELDVMLREARTPKVHDWLVNYVVKKNPHSEELRLAWSADPDPMVAGAGWALTTERVAKKPEGLDLAGLLDVIEAEMKDAPDRLQWAMNHCLAQIGIEHAEHRARAIDIGERLEVLKDYPTPPNCTSPFAPVWITEMVRRQHDK